jgi:hypothetical protein
MPNVPAILADGRYRVVARSGVLQARCPWCLTTTALTQASAQGVLGNGTALPVLEQILLCDKCGRPSIRPGLLSRLVGGVGTLALTLFMLPLFGGAAYFTATMLYALVRGGTFDAGFAVVCIAGLIATGLGLWLPLRRFIEAVRPGPVRIEIPVEAPR